MTRPRTISYRRTQDGSFTIVMDQPWDGQYRFDTYPVHIRFAVMREQAYVNDENEAKLKSAREISGTVFAAVLDDLMCEAAWKIAAREAEADRDGRLEQGLSYEPGSRVAAVMDTSGWCPSALSQSRQEAAADLEPDPDDRER